MRDTGRRSVTTPPGGRPGLSAQLRSAVDRAGFYPAVVLDVLETALAEEEVAAHVVHPETTFDADDEVRRHVTVLALTPTRLVIVHADDHADPGTAAERHVSADRPVAGGTFATVTAEAIPLGAVNGVVTTHVVERPDRHRPGAQPREISIGVAWGIASRIDLEPAACDNPDCEADHGYTGSVTADDLSLRISADAEGNGAVRDALAFARALSAATARRA